MYKINKTSYFDIINITHKGIKVSLINYGAAIKQIQTPNAQGIFEDILLEYAKDEDYINNSIYLNGTVGPIAGRVREGLVSTPDLTVQLSKNQDEMHTLHSGNHALTFKLFSYDIDASYDTTNVIMTYTDQIDYQVNYVINVIYTVSENQLKINYHIVSDKVFPFNLTNHAYFNLSGNLVNDIKNHQVAITSDITYQLDKDQLATNKLLKNPLYDFKSSSELSHRLLQLKDHPYQGYDDIYKFDKNPELTLMASIFEPESHRTLDVYSTYDHMVFYTHNNVNQHVLKHLSGHPIHYGLCFECEKSPYLKANMLQDKSAYKETILFKFGLQNT